MGTAQVLAGFADGAIPAAEIRRLQLSSTFLQRDSTAATMHAKIKILRKHAGAMSSVENSLCGVDANGRHKVWYLTHVQLKKLAKFYVEEYTLRGKPEKYYTGTDKQKDPRLASAYKHTILCLLRVRGLKVFYELKFKRKRYAESCVDANPREGLDTEALSELICSLFGVGPQLADSAVKMIASELHKQAKVDENDIRENHGLKKRGLPQQTAKFVSQVGKCVGMLTTARYSKKSHLNKPIHLHRAAKTWLIATISKYLEERALAAEEHRQTTTTTTTSNTLTTNAQQTSESTPMGSFTPAADADQEAAADARRTVCTMFQKAQKRLRRRTLDEMLEETAHNW